MTYRMTVVLEYPSKDHAPRINAKTKAKDLGDGEVVALQFSDALRELEVLEGSASAEAKRKASWAAENYQRPAQETRAETLAPIGAGAIEASAAEPAYANQRPSLRR